MQIICPKCKSDNCRKLSLIHQENVIHSTGIIRGSIGSKSTAAYKNETKTTSLGKTVAPPGKPKSNIILILKTIFIAWVSIVLCTVFKAFFLLQLLLFIVLPLYLFLALKKNILYSRKYPTFQKKWEESFMCQHCGNIFAHIEI